MTGMTVQHPEITVHDAGIRVQHPGIAVQLPPKSAFTFLRNRCSRSAEIRTLSRSAVRAASPVARSSSPLWHWLSNPTRATRPRCVRGSRHRSSVRRFGWSPRRRLRTTSAWSRDWRTKRIGTTTVALERCCTDRGWSGPGDMGARYARRPDGVRCRVPPASGTCPPVSVLEARQRRLPVLAPGGGLPALLSVLSTASLRAGECGHRDAAAGLLPGLRGWLRLHEKGGRRHDVPAHHRAERHRPLRTGRLGVRAHQPQCLD